MRLLRRGIAFHILLRSPRIVSPSAWPIRNEALLYRRKIKTTRSDCTRRCLDDARDGRIVLTSESLQGIYGIRGERDGTALHLAQRSDLTR